VNMGRSRKGLEGQRPSRKNLSWSRGKGKPGFPFPHPVGGFGRALPSQKQPVFHLLGMRRSRMDGYREHRLLEQGCGETRFPHSPACGRAWSSSRGRGKPGFPTPPPAGGRPEKILLHPVGGRLKGVDERGPSPRLPNVKISPRRGVWGNRVSPHPHPREGLGGRSPPKNKLRFIAALCGGAAWTAGEGKRRRREKGFACATLSYPKGEGALLLILRPGPVVIVVVGQCHSGSARE